jgi:hypothetical protein
MPNLSESSLMKQTVEHLAIGRGVENNVIGSSNRRRQQDDAPVVSVQVGGGLQAEAGSVSWPQQPDDGEQEGLDHKLRGRRRGDASKHHVVARTTRVADRELLTAKVAVRALRQAGERARDRGEATVN